MVTSSATCHEFVDSFVPLQVATTLDQKLMTIQPPDDCPPAEISNEVLLFGAQWLAIKLSKSNGVSCMLNWVNASQSVHQVAPCMIALATSGITLNTDTMHTMTQLILAFLHPHTSSPSMPLVAHTMTSLIMGDFGKEELNQILSTQLDLLAISPQAKQNIIPGLLGIAKLAARVQLQGAPTSALLSQSILPKPKPKFIHMTSGTSYQMHQRPFSSQSGSGYTIWYFSRSNLSILTPPTVPQVKTGHLYVHLDASRDVFQYWIFTNCWECVQLGAEYPLNDQVLAVCANGKPSWVTCALTVTTKARKEKEVQEQLVQG
ncbi:hypothetical protein EDB83DRAFT_2326509 [Lactarius deliciosus]|nr:hypothetical protein EDB83DRAFT_2326509 [Lactarius deliciosus]